MPLNTWTEIYPPFSDLNTVSANTTTDIFYKYIRNSDSFCLFFFLIGINPLPRVKKGAVIFKQQFSLYNMRVEMDRKVMHGR